MALAVGPSAAGAATHIEVTAFQLAGDRLSLIDRSARAIDVVGVDGGVIAENGALVGRPGKDAARQLRRAHKRHLRAELLVSNYSGRLNDFSEPVAHRLRAGVKAALRDVPRRKLELGVAGYGYAWRPHSNDTLSVARARALAG